MPVEGAGLDPFLTAGEARPLPQESQEADRAAPLAAGASSRPAEGVTEATIGPIMGDLTATNETGRSTTNHAITARGLIAECNGVVRTSEDGNLFQVQGAPLTGCVDNDNPLGSGGRRWVSLGHSWTAPEATIAPTAHTPIVREITGAVPETCGCMLGDIAGPVRQAPPRTSPRDLPHGRTIGRASPGISLVASNTPVEPRIQRPGDAGPLGIGLFGTTREEPTPVVGGHTFLCTCTTTEAG